MKPVQPADIISAAPRKLPSWAAWLAVVMLLAAALSGDLSLGDIGRQPHPPASARCAAGPAAALALAGRAGENSPIASSSSTGPPWSLTYGQSQPLPTAGG